MVCVFPDPWVDPKRRSTFWFCNLHHGRIRVQHLGIYFADPPGVWVMGFAVFRGVRGARLGIEGVGGLGV